ncbi:DUF2169 domain-containing protein [Nannocystis sp. SCPEA4]|uniref:DUF2169 family type VI secretion system accessory protein n=1 Tax=Nannocystis sp. SCPEA4 TaxID=2996787 RepID=UPI002270B2B7|nr:DUF2169 domain-containing protein [Nannocystis sp. SCPEA4]MCY1058915.1 DUF2169 domain-containing protein [Nannocystis sp. SCPEA4]
MANLDNLTPYSAVSFPSITPDGAGVDVVCVAARFAMPLANASSAAPLVRDYEQRPPPLEDVFFGEPGASSVRHEAQTAPMRLGTDIYVDGHVCAPGGEPVRTMTASVRVGTCAVSLSVIGDRVWQRSVGGLVLSEPAPFESLPLCYERSFGGRVEDGERLVAWQPRNPVGRGFYDSAARALDQPAPNFERPGQRYTSWKDRPPPAGLGPVSRAWQPRLALAGTFGPVWMQTRAPVWPEDFDPRYYNAAAPGLVALPRLTGGEPVELVGFSPAGPLVFRLPRLRLGVRRVRRAGTSLRAPLDLDGVLLEPDLHAVTLYFRAALPADASPSARDVDIVRELESWESGS